MAEPKTSTVFVRLTRDFPAGVGHRRGGVELTSGPTPVEVEVTDEQLAALEADHYIEILDDKDAQKEIDRFGEAPAKVSADLKTEADKASGNKSGRNYGDGNDDGSNDDDGDEGDQGDGLDDLKFDALKEVAANEEVDITGLNSKDQVREAIRSKREADNSSDEE